MIASQTGQLHKGTMIDVLIPAIEKDLGTLPYVIDSIRKHVKHPIGRIYIISPASAKIKKLCRSKNCTFIHENTVLPITKKDIHYRSSKWERSGWLFQQLLKLSGDQICTSPFYLVIDADTVLIRPHVFRKGKQTIFYSRSWSQPEYFKTYKRLLQRPAAAKKSFVTHYMLFERAKVTQLKKAMQAKQGTSWYAAILRTIDRTKQFSFSEFETYGNFIHSEYPKSFIFKSCLNKSLSMNAAQVGTATYTALAKTYRSVSFHKRKGYVRSPRLARK